METKNRQFNSLDEMVQNDALVAKNISKDIVNTYLMAHLKSVWWESKPKGYLLALNEVVFEMLRFNPKQINDELKDWYYLKLEDICNKLTTFDEVEIHTHAMVLLLQLKRKKNPFVPNLPVD